MNQKVIFTSLDNTLITTKSGKQFPIHSEDWKFIDATINIINQYTKMGYKVVIVTNQGGIALGVLNEGVFRNKIEKICTSLEKLLNLSENSISYRFSTNIQETAYDRKPNPAMAFDVLYDEELTLKDSVMLGDKISDREFAQNAGITDYISIKAILNSY